MYKRPVTMLSTIHDGSMIPKERHLLHVVGGIKSIMKPKMIEEYNKHYGLCGQMTSYSHIWVFSQDCQVVEACPFSSIGHICSKCICSLQTDNREAFHP